MEKEATQIRLHGMLDERQQVDFKHIKNTTRILDIAEREQKRLLSQPDKSGFGVEQSVLALYGRRSAENPKILDNFEALELSLKGKTGQAVFIKKQWLVETDAPKDASHSSALDSVETRSDLYLGILNDDQLDFDVDEKRVYMPTGKFLVLKTGWSTDTLSSLNVSHKPIKVADLDDCSPAERQFRNIEIGEQLNEQLAIRIGSKLLGQVIYSPPDSKILEIAVGTSEIQDWLIREDAMDDRFDRINLNKYQSEFLALRKMAAILGTDVIEPVNDHLRFILELENQKTKKFS